MGQRQIRYQLCPHGEVEQVNQLFWPNEKNSVTEKFKVLWGLKSVIMLILIISNNSGDLFSDP